MMKIDILKDRELLLSDYYRAEVDTMSYGAVSESKWKEIIAWMQHNQIPHRRRGSNLKFERDQDITAFLLRWK